MQIRDILSRSRAFFITVPGRLRAGWTRYRGLKRWQQIAIAVGVIALLGAGIVLARGGATPEDADGNVRTVTVATVGSLSGNGGSVNIIGTVRSVTEADILAQTGGTVRSVNTRIGAAVPAGYVIAQLENASERAAVLQAEGVYEAALAARAAVSPRDATNAARTTYRNAFTTLETALEVDVDTFFGPPTAVGPRLLISPGPTEDLSRKRADLTDMMKAWRAELPSADSRDPLTLLAEAEARYERVNLFLDELARAANSRDSGASAAQVAGLSSARATVSAQLAAIASARETYRSKSTTSTASVDASVKQALGALRGAQATLERTIVRAPIGGVVNFLPIRVGDYVTAYTHVATVAQNGALEIVAYVSEEDRELLTVGSEVGIEGAASGLVTAIAPALDPTTKQIEIRIAVRGADGLVNGQSVRIDLPNTVRTVEPTEGPTMLPLAAVKLRTDSRVVFTVGEDSRLVALSVETGEVRGDRIEILSDLPSETRIVADARGLAEGERVKVAQ